MPNKTRQVLRRIADSSAKALDTAAELLSEKAAQDDRELEERVEAKLRDGARFVPRKRRPAP
jgi:hypothetical protein